MQLQFAEFFSKVDICEKAIPIASARGTHGACLQLQTKIPQKSFRRTNDL